jgi:hypothetical protein
MPGKLLGTRLFASSAKIGFANEINGKLLVVNPNCARNLRLLDIKFSLHKYNIKLLILGSWGNP